MQTPPCHEINEQSQTEIHSKQTYDVRRLELLDKLVLQVFFGILTHLNII